MALAVLGGMDVLFAFIAELEDLQKAYGVLEAGIYTLATFPRRAYEFIPVSALIGCLLALGQLASHSELTVMRSAGVSVYRIVWATLKPVILLAFAGILLSQYVIPFSEQFARSYRALKQGGGAVLRVKQGNWQKEGNDLIHINALAPNGALHGLIRFSFDAERKLTSVGFTEHAHFQGDHWVLEGNQITHLQGPKTLVEHTEQLHWFSRLTPEMMRMVIMEPDYLSITNLHQYARFLTLQGLSYKPYLLAFWKKILQPLATVLMVIMAVSFIFGPLRSVTMGLRVMVGLVTGMLFHYMQDFMSYTSLVFDITPAMACAVPLLVFAVVAFLLMRRAG